jgi:ADP-heptose:LPS heptosyltransferase
MPISGHDKQALIDHNVVDLEQEFVSYSQTAALAQKMDMVIIVCTSVVHLTGGMNIPSIVLVSVSVLAFCLALEAKF